LAAGEHITRAPPHDTLEYIHVQSMSCPGAVAAQMF
jgi:hypothetical protein